jgi:uncharacterized protein YgbK (DUF1537 family)
MNVSTTSKTRKAPLLGCIADDLTGATDLAGMLVSNGMRTVVILGVPDFESVADADAVVVALKSRSVAAKMAVTKSVLALRWLRRAGCRQFYFKYCSTFDSTPKGNIGPVAEALMKELNTSFTIACPAFPANRRTVYNGYLFVNRCLLEESGMRLHPLNPMTDSNLVRLLQAQCSGKVALIDHSVVNDGAQSIARAAAEARTGGASFAVIDAISESNLRDIAVACQDLPLCTGASGLAMGMAESYKRSGLLHSSDDAQLLPHVSGFSAILAGSCSETTQRQVAEAEKRFPTLRLDATAAALDRKLAAKSAEWACFRISEGPVLIAATTDPARVKEAQDKLGIERAGRLVERLLADIARRLIKRGSRRLIVAGGETSGAVLRALSIRSLRVGPEIDPGVHWAVSEGKVQLAFALKSGNFGSVDFFSKAWSFLP